MSRRLTRFDEFPRHQIGATFDIVADGSPHWSDGFYFATGDADGRHAWFMGLRLHANNDVLDAFVCVSSADDQSVLGGRQHNMRWSRRLRPDIDELRCGPLSVEIIEGLRVVRVRGDPNVHGHSCDLLWEGWCPPYNEDHVQVILNGRLHSDRSNYLQCCTVSGWIEVGEVRIAVDGWTGVRDHSWGIGNNTGGPRSTAVAPLPDPPPPPGLRQWCVFRLPDRSVYWQFHHPGTGPYTKFESRCMFPYGNGRDSFAYTAIDHDVRFAEITRSTETVTVPRLASGVVRLTRPDGVIERYAIEPSSYPVYLQGGGYFAGFDDGLGRGVYRGELHDEGETWDIDRVIAVATPRPVDLNRAHYAESWGRCTNLDDPTDSGPGHLECVVLGPHPAIGPVTGGFGS